MNIEEKRILKSTCYYYGASFSNFPLFFNSINENGHFTEKIEKCKWSKNIYYTELNRLISLSTKFDYNDFYIQYKKCGYLQNYNRLVKELNNMFDTDIFPKLYIVDNLPNIPESDKKGWESISVDKLDEKRLKIPTGIYFKEEFLTYCYFEFIIAHELIHYAISNFSKNYFPFTSIYEEGLCDFLAVILLYKSDVLPISAIKNVLTYNRYLKERNSLWYTYQKFFNYFASTMLANGLNSIVSLVKSGRDKISKLNFSDITETIKDDSCTQFILEVLDLFSLISLPICEYIVLKYTINNEKNILNIDSIINDTLLPKNVSLNALEELNKKGYIYISGNQILQMNQCFFNNIKFINE